MNTSNELHQASTHSELMARCHALLKQGNRVAAVKLYRSETRANLLAAMKALGLK